MVVDDDPSVLALHRSFLGRVGGIEVVATADRGAKVVGLVDEHRVELVLLDIGLPDIDGVEVLRELRERIGPDVAVVMVTAQSDRETVRRVVHHGVDGYLVKPFHLDEFVSRLERVRDVLR
ncbi:MAG: response regulator, partial [Microbacteriaceae bacterium]